MSYNRQLLSTVEKNGEDAMKQKTDLRVVKTYTALTNAFYQLLSEKKFEEITVNELCNLAFVRRATFYKHFADKYEFFTFVVRTVFEQYSGNYDFESGQVKPLSFYLNIMENVLHFLTERESMVRSFTASSMYSTLMNIFTDELSQEVKAFLEEDEKNGAVFPASADITARFFTGAMINCIKYWFASDRSLSEAELLNQIEAILYSFTPHLPASYE